MMDIGHPSLLKSKFLKRINSGEDPNTVAQEEIPKWVYINQVKKDGSKISVEIEELKIRREKEVQKFIEPVEDLED